jgi:oligopeptide/dipeptide ABC transporter ATP-binding protein
VEPVPPPAPTPLLAIERLVVEFATERGPVLAVRGVDLTMEAGETLCLVGESGCGKSVTCHTVLGLTPANGRVIGGRILFDGRDLLAMPEREQERLRGRRIAMIFQDPLTSLNPVHTIGRQLSEVLVLHRGLAWSEAVAEARRLLDLVRIPDAARRLAEYPHQLSGGMNQRVMIAMAMACRPELIIADEPTTALDVTIQAQILMLLREMRETMGMSLLLVTHDLGVVAEMADRVAVMYLGRIVETAGTDDLFAHPRHPYTAGLLRSMPRVDMDIDHLTPIEGTVPSLAELPAGCAFHPRCGRASGYCAQVPPDLAAADAVAALAGEARHRVACHHAGAP